MTNPRRLSGFLALSSVALLAACHSSSKQDEQPTLRVADQLHTLQSAIGAAGEGQPKSYQIQWSNFIGGPAVIAAETGGSVDLGWMAETPMVFAQAAGSPVRVVAVSRGLKPGTSNIALVVAANSPIHSVADLKGKKIGYTSGTISQYLVARLLDQAGLNFDDITSVSLSGISTAVLDNGTVDAFTAAEPMLTQGIEAGKLRVLAYGGQPVTPGYGYLVASEAALADPKRAALIADFVERTARSVKWQRENVDKAAQVSAKAYNVTPALAGQILRRMPLGYTPIDASIVAGHQQESDLFHKFGLIRQRVDASKLFDHRFDALVRTVENGR
ncbi:sulfonate transport system substrate-binding protein [Novosphingobium sp. PhB165]|uniref:aliphatic sulfonate ABC transporter substrate-binding protein n=1 Tax=Novosphingobium sp. PhB165 TaxID=2485105 RepID=UPI001043B5F3|nr:aliphatic sulfonate ABC transporter substrate-binding protein [Novosphingobium sp. PhB165]TCM20458.1 sulfonate transport system substrate-binding protein [Novosphingobium sp. PhB165]